MEEVYTWLINGWTLQILLGALATVTLAIFAYIVGLSISLFFAICQFLQLRKVSLVEVGYITLFRCMPELLVVMCLYFVFTTCAQALSIKGSIIGFISAVISLGLICGSYLCAVFKAGLRSISEGQLEAGYALGLSKARIIKKILLPQLIGYTFQPVLNVWLVLLKDTSIVSLVGISELMFRTNTVIASTLSPFTFYSLAGIFYLLITAASNTFLGKLSSYLSKSLKVE